MSKNGYLKKQKDTHNQILHVAERITEQYMEDTLEIAMKRAGHGYVTIKRMLDLWMEVRREYKPSLDPKDPEADVAQEHMDNELRHIVKDHQPFIPHRERYPELKKITYGGKSAK